MIASQPSDPLEPTQEAAAETEAHGRAAAAEALTVRVSITSPAKTLTREGCRAVQQMTRATPAWGALSPELISTEQYLCAQADSPKTAGAAELDRLILDRKHPATVATPCAAVLAAVPGLALPRLAFAD